MSRLAEVIEIYTRSDGARTSALYAELKPLGPDGIVALNLFRAQKASERAKAYRNHGFRFTAYAKKQWSIDQVCEAVAAQGERWRWGWGLDPAQPVHCHVLYVELPTGQVSFHAEKRGIGPDYPGVWDGQKGQSPDRICRWVAQVLEGGR